MAISFTPPPVQLCTVEITLMPVAPNKIEVRKIEDVIETWSANGMFCVRFGSELGSRKTVLYPHERIEKVLIVDNAK